MPPGGKADPPGGVQIIARSKQIGGQFGDIHRASAAEANDRYRAGVTPRRDGRQQGILRRVRLDRIEQNDFAKRGSARSGEPQCHDVAVSHE